MGRIFFLVLFFISNSTFSQSQVSGYVYDLITGKTLAGTRVTVSILDSIKAHKLEQDDILLLINPKRDLIYYDTSYKIVKSTFTDSTGFYLFDSLDVNIYSLSAFFRTKEIKPKYWEGEWFDTTGIRLTRKSATELSFTLHVTCEYDSTLINCPICHKKDRVLPIAWGLPVFPLEPGFYYNGFCVIPRCHPTKRCMRCAHEF